MGRRGKFYQRSSTHGDCRGPKRFSRLALSPAAPHVPQRTLWYASGRRYLVFAQSIENHFSPREGSARVSLIGDWLHPVVMKSSPLVFILRAPDCDILLPLLLVLVICFYHVYIVQWLHKYQCFVRRQARFKDGLPIIICFLARKDRACHTPVSPKGQRFQIS
jgi:hypothetical protein